MKKKVIGRIKLAPYVPAWYDAINNIHLVRPNNVSVDLKEGVDLQPIMKGVHAGYIVFKEVTEEVKQKVKESKPKKAEVEVKMDPETPIKPKKKAASKKQVKQEEVVEEQKNEEVVVKEEQKNEEDK